MRVIITKVRDIFKLNKSHYEPDFVDVNPDNDIPLFLAPYFLSKCDFSLTFEANTTIKSFFEYLLRQLEANKTSFARELFSYLNEPNKFCLGLSRGKPDGKDIGSSDSEKIL